LHGASPPAATASTQSIRFLGLNAQFETIKSEVVEAAEQVTESQQFILGSHVALLEEEVARMIGFVSGDLRRSSMRAVCPQRMPALYDQFDI